MVIARAKGPWILISSLSILRLASVDFSYTGLKFLKSICSTTTLLRALSLSPFQVSHRSQLTFSSFKLNVLMYSLISNSISKLIMKILLRKHFCHLLIRRYIFVYKSIIKYLEDKNWKNKGKKWREASRWVLDTNSERRELDRRAESAAHLSCTLTCRSAHSSTSSR